MSIYSVFLIICCKFWKIWVGNVLVGGDVLIVVQSMINIEICDVVVIVVQICCLEDVGVDIVWVFVFDMDVVEVFGKIKQQVNVLLVVDIYFDYCIVLCVVELGVDCLCINLGNIGCEDWVKVVVDVVCECNILICIGVNVGLLEKDLQKKYGELILEVLFELVMCYVDYFDKLDFQNFKVSVKVFDVFMVVVVYCLLVRQIEQFLYLGIIEVGGLCFGMVKLVVGLGMFLVEGIGDIIWIFLVVDLVEEIKVGFDIFKFLYLCFCGINFIVCLSCLWQNFDVVKIMNELEGCLEDLLVLMDVVVIGCVVNGLGEVKEVYVGFIGGILNLVYIDGKLLQKLINDNLVDELEWLICQKVVEKVEVDVSLIVCG